VHKRLYRSVRRCSPWVLGLLLIVTAIVSTVSAQQTVQTLKIGIVTATSGSLAAPGQFQLNGFRMAAEEINERGGVTIDGVTYRIELVVYDTKGIPTEGASAVLRLATVDRVPVILGELSSGVALAQAPVARDHKVPIIFTVPTAPSITEQGNPWVFRVNAHNNSLNVGLAEFIIAQGWNPVAFIGWNNDAGRLGISHMTELLQAAGITVSRQEYFNLGETNFTPQLTNIRRAGAQAIMLFADEEPGALIIEQAMEMGLQVQWIGTLAFGSDRMLQYLPPSAIAGMIQYNAFPPRAPIERIRNFNERYLAAFGEEAHGFAAQSYDGLMVAIEAMKKANTVTDTEAIREALATIRYEGVIGLIEFDESGQAHPPVYVTQWCADGTRRILAPEPGECGTG